MIAVEILGEGKNVVVLHGCPVPPESVATITKTLQSTYRVIVPNYFGLGLAPKELVTELIAALQREGIKETAIVGHSFGTYLAFQLALSEEIEVTRIVGLGAVAHLPDEVVQGYEALAQAIEADAIDVAEALLPQWFSPDFLAENPQIAPMVRRWFDDLGKEGLITAARVEAVIREDVRPRLAAIEVPVYLRVGALDASTPAAWSEEIARRLPEAEFDVVEGTSHFPHLEDEEATLAAIVGFLGEL